jgi:hypothetical protein
MSLFAPRRLGIAKDGGGHRIERDGEGQIGLS